MLRTATLVIVAAACGTDYSTLADLPNKRLTVHVDSTTPTSVVLYSNRDATGGCPILDESTLTGSFGGFPMTFKSYGKWDIAMTGETGCSVAFTAPFEIVPMNGVVAISNGSQHVAATFEQAALERRSAAHPDWSFHLGETITLQWSHAVDLVGSRVDAFVSIDPSTPQLAVIVPPSDISFTVPASEPTGPSYAIVEVHDADDPAESPEPAVDCLNASPCTASHNHGYVHDVTVYP